MFRELARKKQALSEARCIEILKSEKRGVLSVLGDGGYPYGMPLNHYYNEDDGCIYFHTGKRGHRTDAIKKEPKASYCVYDGGYLKDGDWALNVSSVIVFGRVEIVEDHALALDISRRLSYKFTDDEAYIAYELEHSGNAVMLLRLTPEHMTGKLVNEK